MKAVVIEAFREPLTLQEVPNPTAPKDGVVIRVMASGICRSDWHGWMGHDPLVTLPHVPGHEFAGVIEEIGQKIARWKIGDRVTVPFSCGCNTCPQCRAGFPNLCDNEFQPGFSGWGAFAQYIAVPYADANLVGLPDQIDFVEASVLGCRFMTAFRGLVDQGRVSSDDWVAIHGCGGVGLSAVMIASSFGAKVIGVDINDEKLDLAKSMGAIETINATIVTNPVEAIRQISDGGAHISVDALGSVSTSRNSILCLRKRGRHVQIGLTVGDESDVSIPMDQVIAKELEIIGTHGMPAHRYNAVLKMIISGKLNPRRLVNKVVLLEESIRELEAMGQFETLGITIIDSF